MRLLLFDTVLDGHHTDYLTHLITYWQAEKLPGKLFLVTPEGLAEELPAEQANSSNIEFVEITSEELETARNGSIVSRSFAGWNLYVKYATQIRPDHALLMYFDLFQMGLWLGKKSPCPVSGIYFRPNFSQIDGSSLKENLMVSGKKLLLNRALSNPAFSVVFCLDHSAIPAVQKIANRVKVRPLSDPVMQFDLSTDQLEGQRKALGIKNSRKVFLLFGHLDDRKGIEPVLDAIEMMPSDNSRKLALVLAGPIDSEFRSIIESRIAASNADAQIICQFQTFKGATIQSLFSVSDFVLTLYRKHVGMSSIVVRAALSQKPLISSDFGYLGNLVESQHLGVTVDSESPSAICEAFCKALQGEIVFDQEAAKKLADKNTARAFAKQILEGISE
ncbi:glycosyltransferase [Persicitalea sp.]|uniref:glycosyltransferase n=1 Tax=Persicitalea sp. TaxID=3100273 RepID=UPI003593E24B